MKARQMLQGGSWDLVLQYEIDNQRGSHRKLVRALGTHRLLLLVPRQRDLGPVLVRKISISDVGLSEEKAKEVL